MIAITALCAVWGLWSISVASFVNDSKVEVTTNISQLAEQLKAGTYSQQRAIQAWPQRLNLMEERADAQAALEQVSKEVHTLLNRAMEPHEVSELLHTLLAEYPEIELIELTNLPSEAVEIGQQVSDLYRHPLKLTLNGQYAEVVHYLEALEALPVGVAFRNLSYQVDDYPRANVTIEIVSFSRNEAWLGA